MSRISIFKSDLALVVSHCLAVYPNEACGILAGISGRVQRVIPIRNVMSSPTSYMMDSQEQHRTFQEIRANGMEMIAIYHSHPSSPPVPSARDRELACWDGIPIFPGIDYIIVGLQDGETIIKAYNVSLEGWTSFEMTML